MFDFFRRKAKAKAKGKQSPSTATAESSANAAAQPSNRPSKARNGHRRVEITLELRDVIRRLPTEYLAPGSHDLDQILKFDINDLAEKITSGQPTIRVAEIYRQIPTLFRTDLIISDALEIRFPWSKLLELIRTAELTESKNGVTDNAALRLARQLRAQRRHDTSDRANGAKDKLATQQTSRKRLARPARRHENPLVHPGKDEEQPSGNGAETQRLREELEARTKEFRKLQVQLEQERQAAEQIIADLTKSRNELIAELERLRPPGR